MKTQSRQVKARPISTAGRFFALLLTSISILAVATASAQEVRLVYDAEGSGNGRSSIGGLLPVGDLAYLLVNDDIHGGEIWRTDGTAAGSYLLADFCPGPCASRPGRVEGSMAVLGNEVLVNTSQPVVQGLWKTDGTSPLVRLRNGQGFSLYRLDDGVVYARYNAAFQPAIWASDGTREGTRQISFAAPTRLLTKAGSRAFFPTSPSRLWTTDGTAVGTYLVQDLGADVRIWNTVALGDRAVIQVLGKEGVWVSDGVDAKEILRLQEGQSFHAYTSLPTTSELAYFMVYEQNQDETRLWRTDGTAAGTWPVVRACSGTCVFDFDVPWKVVGQRLFFILPTSDEGWDLWTSDGTTAGTLRLVGLQWKGSFEGDRFRLTALDDRLVYADYAPDKTRFGLWSSDGTVEGTEQIAEFSGEESYVESFAMLADGDELWLALRHEQPPGAVESELWRSDGTVAGTRLIETLAGRFEGLIGMFGSRLIFTFDDSEHGVEPWISGAGQAGAHLLTDIVGEEGGLADASLNATRQAVFFSVRRPSGSGYGLWRSDGTPLGTTATPFLDQVSLPTLIPFRDQVLAFTAHDELWLSDGTAEGSVLLVDELRESGEWAILDDTFYFVELADLNQGQMLWRTDGTPSGTRPIMTLNARDFASPGLFAVGDVLIMSVLFEEGHGLLSIDGTSEEAREIPLPFRPYELMQVKEKAYFTNLPVQTELWETDGSEAGTRKIFSFAELPAGRVEHFMHSEEALYFLGRSDDGGRFMWRSDGTRAGTRRLGAVPTRPRTTFHPQGFVASGDTVFFSIDDPGLGVELWKADSSGVGRVLDICPGECSSLPQAGQAIAGRLYFAASDGVSGLEPWTTDGTAAGTYRLADLNPGPESSNPGGFAGFAGEIYFHAHRRDLGTALWAYDLLGDCREDAAHACLGEGRFTVTVDWRSQHGGGEEGQGQQLPFSDLSRLFWFFNSDNVELVVKILDGRPINGAFWFFYGALTDVEYTIAVQDRLTGRRASFYNPPGQICGASDIHAFPEADTPLTVPRSVVRTEAIPADFTPASSASTCQSDATTLCLRDGRFKVAVRWRDRQTGELRSGQVLPGTSESGYFWFFDPQNLELIVKVLDGRSINGKFWVFYGALSDVEYSVTVTDLMTGASKSYDNPSGEICGVGDTLAFDG